MSSQAALEFICSLELDESLTPDSSQGKVVAGSLASFTHNLSGQQLEDVQNSTLFAQLAATKKYPKKEQATDWYEFYGYVLGKLGWILQGFSFDEYKSSADSFKLSEVTLELLSAMIGEDKQLVSVVKDTLDSLKKSPEGLTLFNKNSTSSNNGRFQILPCTVTNGQVSLAFIGAYFKANKVSSDYFFFSYNFQEIQLHKSTQVFTLNEDVYMQVRQGVINRLGKRAKDFVHNLDI
ncbi:uncharacterized protein LOC111320379 [Stylophora pistillata]|nr:uncharacterized protein LOC111320379 [Stylophora pistillata]